MAGPPLAAQHHPFLSLASLGAHATRSSLHGHGSVTAEESAVTHARPPESSEMSG